eukprot:jgi/Mesvir1/22665/Mv14097-RA.1
MAPLFHVYDMMITQHAGYFYSGRCAAWAYKNIDPTNINRVFLLGSFHHAYVRKVCATRFTVYQTPLGDLPIDTEVVKDLLKTGKFDVMSEDVDEAEHSMEMHLPYIRKVFGTQAITLVPLMVGSITPSQELAYGRILAPYLDDPRNLFVISSDFCHWGSRFRFTYYDRSQGPIHKSIEHLDHLGMSLIERGDISGYTEYLDKYENTICGRHPIGILMNAISACKTKIATKFVQYDQSSRVESHDDSSVSYAAAVSRAIMVSA